MARPVRLAVVAATVAVVTPLSAQVTRLDSARVADAIAKAIRPRIQADGFKREVLVDERPASAFAAPQWNRLVAGALRALDSSLISREPTVYTMRINVVRVTDASDSIVARVAFTQCRDTPRGIMFGGSSFDYVFRKAGADWTLQHDRPGGNGDGRCTGRPDSVAQQFLIQTILNSSDHRIARAAGDTALRVFRIQYPAQPVPRWEQFTDVLLQRLHARLLTDADTRTFELVITELGTMGDTLLLGRFRVGNRQRCPREPWIGGATEYDMRARKSSAGWELISVRTAGIGDTRSCR